MITFIKSLNKIINHALRLSHSYLVTLLDIKLKKTKIRLIHVKKKQGKKKSPMFKKIFSNVILSIFLDKTAKEKLQAHQKKNKTNKSNKITQKKIKTETSSKSVDNSQPQTNKRQTLIKNALAIHKKQSKILDNLGEKDKKRLQLLALRTMLRKIKHNQ